MKRFMTLKPSLVLLDGAKAERGGSFSSAVWPGAVVFYVLHLYVIHVVALLVTLAFNQPVWHGASSEACRRSGSDISTLVTGENASIIRKRFVAVTSNLK